MTREKKPLERKPRTWVIWGVIAACLCVVIAGFFVIRQRPAALPVEQVENPVLVSREETPVMQRDDLKNMLVNNTVIRGTVQDCSYLRIRAGDSVWYLTTMRVAVDAVIRGEVDAPAIDIVSGECYTGEGVPEEEFPVRSGIADCVPGTEGIFAVSPVQADAVWDIGGRSTAVREFGDYIYRIRCSLQGGSIVYDDLVLPVSEVEDAKS